MQGRIPGTGVQSIQKDAVPAEYDGGTMLKDYEINKPVLETDRLIIRSFHEADVPL